MKDLKKKIKKLKHPWDDDNDELSEVTPSKPEPVVEIEAPKHVKRIFLLLNQRILHNEHEDFIQKRTFSELEKI
jgi:hypothetical protein